MPLATPLILYPVRFGTTAYVVRVTTSSTQDLPFPATGSLNTSRNYWASGDAQSDSDGSVGGIGDLLAMLKAALDANAGGRVFTITLLDSARNQILISATGSFTIHWSHINNTLDETIFGFTNSDTAGGSSATAPNQTRGVWAPQFPCTVDTRDQQEILGATDEAISGLSRTSRLALPRKVRDLRWNLLLRDRILTEYTPATEPYGSLEFGWINSLSYGQPLRFYEDTASRTSTSYNLYRLRQAARMPYARDERYLIRWRADLPLRRVTE